MIRNGKFTLPRSSTQALEKWTRDTDPVRAWIEARVRPSGNPKGDVGYARTAVFEQFVIWAVQNGYRKDRLPKSPEFIDRLAADLPAIRRELIKTPAGADIVEIKSGVSDPHNGGRCVNIVTFADDTHVVYKPKDLRLDVALSELVERLNGAGAPVALKTARALSRDGYGWTEFIAHTGCADAAGVTRFFRRAGAFLALLHVFAATDMHQENMIACADHPVPPTGAAVQLQGNVVGYIANAAWSPLLGYPIALAYLDTEVAVVGIPLAIEGASATTVSAPFVRTRSNSLPAA